MEQAAASAAPAHNRANQRVFRFASFEVTPATAELRKNGLKVRLGGQPFRILVLLLEKPGQVVTREALRRELWPDHTHVDFDHCLNTAINKLRETLGDSAEKPRFIQTIPRVGYRFLAPVELAASPTETAQAQPAPTASPKPRWPARRLLVGLVLALATVLVWSLWRTPARRAAPARSVTLTSFGGTETTPSFSPDGTEVAFCWSGQAGDNFDIYVQPVDRGKLRRLTFNPADEFGPAYSPDGRFIAFYRRAGDYAAVYLVSPSGDRTERLFALAFGPPGRTGADESAWVAEQLSWSPDGKLLAVVDRDSPDGPLRIFLRDIAAGRSHALTFPPAGWLGDGSPSFSADGQYVAFVRRSAPDAGDVFVAPVVGGSPKRLTTGGGRIQGLTWTPDGQRIVFSSDRTGDALLWSVAVSGGEVEPVAGTAAGASFPALSATAGRLVYARAAEVGYVMKTALLEPVPQRVIPFPASTPQLSPDGRRLALSSTRGGRSEIWVSAPDGTQARRVISVPTFAGSPRWSPDGAWIAFDSLDPGGWDVYLVRSDGAELRRVTSHEGSDVRPSWSRDGRWLYFGSDRGGTMEIWKSPLSGERAVQITFQGGYDAVESPDGKRIFYTRRGVPGLWTTSVDGKRGEERLLLKELEWQNSRNWTVRKDGVYFFACEGSPHERECCLKRYRFDTGSVETVASLGSVRLNNSGCSISPDGEALYFVQRAESETDIVMVEGWR